MQGIVEVCLRCDSRGCNTPELHSNQAPPHLLYIRWLPRPSHSLCSYPDSRGVVSLHLSDTLHHSPIHYRHYLKYWLFYCLSLFLYSYHCCLINMSVILLCVVSPFCLNYKLVHDTASALGVGITGYLMIRYAVHGPRYCVQQRFCNNQYIVR